MIACDRIVRNLMPILLLQVLRHVDNLRSAVAKNALLTIIDMFTGLGQLMDPELGPVMPVLLKSASSGNQFLIASAEAALDAMVSNLTPSRALGTLIANANSRSPPVRCKCAMSLEACIAQHSCQPREVPRVLQVSSNR